MSSIMIVLLMVISSGARYLGIVSYLALSILIVINVFKNSHKNKRYVIIFALLTIFLANSFYTLYLGDNIDPVVGNFLLQILFLLTLDYKKEQPRLVLEAMKWQILLSILLGLVGYIGINNSMLIDAGSAKGFSGFYALAGIFATPQLLASVCIAFLLFQPVFGGNISRNDIYNNICKYTALGVMLLSLNRVNILFYMLWKIVTLLKRKFGGMLILFCMAFFGVILCSITISYLSLDGTLLQTVQSRLALILGVISTIDFNDVWQLLFGVFNSIHFYLPEYFVDINYIENGFLFIFKYFGILGLITYVAFTSLLAIALFREGYKLLALYAIFYLIVVQNFTNEFVSFIFPQIIYLLMYCAYVKNRDVIVLNKG
ncbi:hypothetical protein HV211_08590 [Citrobacter freundii]|uniref:hypothetical protein n=1 Tax=Citrobacter freundii TaxID=546 RepID=UPI0015E926A6|nr:hypothetical protein [Citrobacter freundii]QLY60535.1 hypothetical protein HV211_08590 [Citrobacter freundii]